MTTATPTYPLFLNLADRATLVVGGGPVATGRARALLAAGSTVTLVAPEATDDICAWDADPSTALTWRRRAFTSDDVAGAWLVHAATGVAAVDDAVVAAADAAGTWSVRASQAATSPAWSAATAVGDDGVRVAVSGGHDPVRAIRVRDAVTALLRSGDLPLRRRRKPDPAGGSVSLVGGGPGDPDLLTLRGWRRLRAADVVVVDHLAPQGLLDHLDADVEVHYAGKMPGTHHLSQQQINALIVERAREGHRVVRLKGGDPFVLGRGGEEAQACVRAGVPVEVVPGVTSAISVPAAAGIPLTHRGVTSSFVLLSGHDGLAAMRRRVGQAPSDATIVMLMGTRALRALSELLLEQGRRPETAAAVIERGWTPEQRVLTGTLADIADIADRGQVRPPAIVVVGDVVRLRYEIGDVARAGAAAAYTEPHHVPARVPGSLAS